MKSETKTPVEHAIWEAIHSYVGSDSMSDCWAAVSPLLRDVTANAKLDEAKWWFPGHICANTQSCPECERLETLNREAARQSGKE